jgi:hypothetical protein
MWLLQLKNDLSIPMTMYGIKLSIINQKLDRFIEEPK